MCEPRWRHRHLPESTHQERGATPSRYTDGPHPGGTTIPDERLLPGMLGKARIVLGRDGRALRLPTRAVYTEFEVDFVYVLAEDDDAADGTARTERRRVRAVPVPFRPDLIDIEEGIEKGELVALSGVRDLRDGISVRFREQDATWNER